MKSCIFVEVGDSWQEISCGIPVFSITRLMGLAYGGSYRESGLNKFLTSPERLWDKGYKELSAVS
ncbi:MAG: hypothetical protein KJ704_04185 [Proteobacteria bacterium]|nr:hypothetical protein [Pseudomonadota bacterium]